MIFVDLRLINCEIELDLLWTKDCLLTKNLDNITGVNFMITITKLCVKVVFLPNIDKARI